MVDAFYLQFDPVSDSEILVPVTSALYVPGFLAAVISKISLHSNPFRMEMLSLISELATLQRNRLQTPRQARLLVITSDASGLHAKEARHPARED